MKTFATSLIAAVILAAATSSPALANGTQQNAQLRSGSSCLPNAVSCRKEYRPRHPRCYTVAVRQNGTIQKKRVCSYS